MSATHFRVLLVAVAVGMMGFGTTPAKAQTVSTEASVGALSAFIDQGERISARPVLQAEGSVSIGALSFAGFVNVDTPIDGQDFTVSQADAEAILALPTNTLDAEVGYTFTTAPFTDDGTLNLDHSHEIFGEAAYPGLITPRLFLVYDVWAVNALYGEVGLGHEIELGTQPVELEGVVGFDTGYLDVGDDLVVSHIGLNASTAFPSGLAEVELLGGIQYSTHSVYQAVSDEVPVFLGARLNW